MVDSWEILPVDRRPLPALQRRPVQRGRRQPPRRHPAPPGRPDRGRQGARAPGQRGRRPRQHHRAWSSTWSTTRAAIPPTTSASDRITAHTTGGDAVLFGTAAEGDDAAEADAEVGRRRAPPRGPRRPAPPRAGRAAGCSPGGWACSCVAFLAIVGIAVGVIVYMGRNTYYVGVAGRAGRHLPGPARWVSSGSSPSSAETHRPSRSARSRRPASTRSQAGVEESSLDDAQRYVANLQDADRRRPRPRPPPRPPRPPSPRRPRPPRHRRPAGVAGAVVGRSPQHRARPDAAGGDHHRGAYVLASLGPSARIPANIVPFLVIVLGLLLGAHVAVRRLAPDADPLLLPIAALLNGLGYVFIARLDEDLPAAQASWTAVGIVAFVATLCFVSGPGSSSATATRSPSSASACCCCRCVPGIGETINGTRIWVGDRAGQLPARRVRQDRAGHLLRRLPGRAARAARHGQRLEGRAAPPPRPQAPRAGPLAWARRPDRDGVPEGPRLLAAVLRPVRGDALGRHRARVATSWSAVACSRRARACAWTPFAHVQDRVDDLARPVDGPERQRLPDHPGPVRPGLRRHRPAPASASAAHVRIPAGETDFIFAVIGEELGLLGGTLVLVRLPADGRLGPAHRRRGPTTPSTSCSPPASPP